MGVDLCYSKQLADVNTTMLRILVTTEGNWGKISKRAHRSLSSSKAGQWNHRFLIVQPTVSILKSRASFLWERSKGEELQASAGPWMSLSHPAMDVPGTCCFQQMHLQDVDRASPWVPTELSVLLEHQQRCRAAGKPCRPLAELPWQNLTLPQHRTFFTCSCKFLCLAEAQRRCPRESKGCALLPGCGRNVHLCWERAGKEIRPINNYS